MKPSIVSLILLALIASSTIGAGARNVLKREANGGDEGAEVSGGSDDAKTSESKTNKSSGSGEEESSSKSDEESSGSKTGGDSRSAVAAAAAASAVASASASGATASASAAAADLIDVDASTAAAAGVASVSSSSSSASASSSTTTTTTTTTTEELASRSGIKEELDSATTPKPTGLVESKSDDEESEVEVEVEVEDTKSASAVKEEPTEGKEKDAVEGESRAGFLPDLLAKATAGFNFRTFDLFQNLTPKNNTIVLSLKAGPSSTGPDGQTTPAPALIINRNGTKMISEGGTLRPVAEEKAKEMENKLKSDPESFKLETFASVSEYEQVSKVFNVNSSARVDTRQMLINNLLTTLAPNARSTSAKPTPAATRKPSMTTTSKKPAPPMTSLKPMPVLSSTAKPQPKSTKPPTKPPAPTTTKKSTTTSAPTKPVVGGSTSKKPTTGKPTTGKPTTGKPTTVKPTVKHTTKSAVFTSTTTKLPVKSTSKPAPSVRPTTTRSPCNQINVADFQSSDKLLAIAVTNKGYFKGRRINAKAIETIMKGKLQTVPSLTQIDKGITVSPNNSFVFPAGHYYFPHPVRFAGFQSP